MWPATGQQVRMFSNIRGRALVAKQTAASVDVGTTPATWIWPTVQVADGQYDGATGNITIAEDCFFTSVASWRVVGSTNRIFYADAEFSLDGGVTWQRGADSLREEQVSSASRTLSFPFAGWYPAGTMLRFIAWASGSGVTAQTNAVGTSTAPAARLTYTTITGMKVTP